MSSSATISLTCLPQASLTGMPRDTFTHLEPFLDRRDLGAVASVDRMANSNVKFVRDRAKHLDISCKKSPYFYLNNISDLKHALRLYPNFNSIDFSGYKRMSADAGEVLGAALKARDMITVIGRRTKIEHRFMQAYPISTWGRYILRDLDHVSAAKGTPSTLEHLDLEGVEDDGLLDRITLLVSRCERLKTLVLPVAAHWEYGMNLIGVLPPTLEFLGPNWTDIHDGLATFMMSRFLPANIRGCNLTFQSRQGHSIEKRFELLQFLPLESMTQIELAGANIVDRLGRQANDLVISTPMLQHITSRISQNANLKTLKLSGLMKDENLTDAIVQLINSIQSPKLEELILLSDFQAILDMTPVLEALAAKLPEWPGIKTIQIVDLATKNLFPCQADEEIKIQQLIEIVHAGQDIELDYGTSEKLNSYSIPTILTHYVNQHNQIDPANPVTPVTIIQVYKSFAPDNDYLPWNRNTKWNNPKTLVERVLEPGLRFVKEQNIKNRAKQDAEHEEILTHEVTSPLPLAEASSSPPASKAVRSAEEKRELIYAAVKARQNKDAS